MPDDIGMISCREILQVQLRSIIYIPITSRPGGSLLLTVSAVFFYFMLFISMNLKEALPYRKA